MIEQAILSGLLYKEDFARKVLPFVLPVYFHQQHHRVVFEEIDQFVKKYQSLPTKEVLKINISQRKGISETTYKQAVEVLDQVQDPGSIDITWLTEKTEKFCQDKAIYNAIMDSIQILDGKTQQDKGAIPTILSAALAISFDTNIGHDYIEDAASRYEYYHKVENRIPFDLELMNKITKGGIPRKTLSIVMAGTGVGKSFLMCHFAASNLARGYNVLYITMEMAQEKISERIDANLMNVTVDELAIMPRDVFEKRINRIKQNTTGKLIVKEFPTSSAHSGHFRHLLDELALKKNFTPDIIYIDYLNICASSRSKRGANINSYEYVKAIAEELRGLAVEYNVPIFSATQVNRTGFTSSDFGLEDTSESFGLPATADLMFALISTEELEEMNQILFKQLKNRYDDMNKLRRFVVGIDRPKFKLYDCEQAAQDDILDDVPAFDRTKTGGRLDSERKFDKSAFDGFN